MRKMGCWAVYLTVALLAIASGTSARANTVTIDFESGPIATGGPYAPGSGTNNFTLDKFIFSPSCHYDRPYQAPGRPGAPTGYWLGYDASGCYDDPTGQAIGYNPNYLGPGGPVLLSPRIFVAQEFGALFSLESLMFASIADDTGGIQVYSSKGGFFSTSYSDGLWIERTFNSDVWRDVAWLEFRGGGGGAPAGFDNLRLSSAAIPEPSTLPILILSLGLMALVARRIGANKGSAS